MIRILLTALLALAAAQSALLAQPSFRRGNPTTTLAHTEFYLVDSDDDSPLKPTYNFVDTTYGTWTRINNWSNTDDGYSYVPTSVPLDTLPYYLASRLLLVDTMTITPPSPALPFVAPGASISTNGTIDLRGSFHSPNNVALPNDSVQSDLVAPLWSDWELRTSGDSSKVFVRSIKDSFYVSYYNLALKGTNGKVRATFQVVFCPKDTSITFEYKSFDGSWNGVSASTLIQSASTIGISSGAQTYNSGITYLHKGYYYATNPSSLYQANLHNQLTLRFFRQAQDAFQILTISNPPKDRYELPTNVLAPQASIQNLADSSILIYVRTTITNLASGQTYYARNDSILTSQHSTTTYTAPTYSGVPCGPGKVTVSITYPNGSNDQWAGNNTFTRYFNYIGSLTAPFRDEFNTAINTCSWENNGVTQVDATQAMYVPDAAITDGPKALVFNRFDASGNPYPTPVAGDTLTSAPMDLSGQSDVYLYFHYQRGLKTDSSQAGIFNRLLSGPEMPVASVQLGDTLFVEGITSSQSATNPATWTVLGAIPGGFDFKTQTFRIKLPAAYLHNHFRARIRLAAQNQAGPANWFDDADNFVVDQFHIEPVQANKTELEPIDVEFGNGIFNRVPRNLSQGLTPMVRIMNNGEGVSLGLNVLHLIIHDALNRAVYDKTVPFSFPQPRADSLIPMPAWDLHGSQGGVFTARVALEQTFYESYRSNDTNVFYKTMYIGDAYGLDDGQPDTVGTTKNPAGDFTFVFTPLSTDTLRGIDFYYTGISSSSTWSLNIQAGDTSYTRSMAYSPLSAGFVRSTFLPIVTHAGVPDTMHFVMNSGSNLGGDAQFGLAYKNASNTGYSVLHPEVLSKFFYGNMGNPFTTPSASDAAQGGALLPMFRLVYSGSQTFLPVKLTSANASRLRDGAVAITWTSALEEHVAAYEITRLADRFGVAAVPATGGTKAYTAVDRSAPASEVTYQIRERDVDGSVHELGRVTASAVEDLPLSVSAWPNPSVDHLTLLANRPIDLIVIFDPAGRRVRTISNDGKSVTILTQGLSAGLYFAEVHSGSEVSRVRFAIIR